MSKRDFLSVDDISSDELVALLDGADRHKADRRPRATLAGRTVALIFEKPSTRTRVSFEVAVHELGGYPLPLAGGETQLGRGEIQLGRGETIEDTAAVLSRYVHAIVLRTFAQENLERLARAGTVPVVNALSDYSHPCQALADLQTIRERKGRLAGLRLAYLGDGNNVAHSLLFAGAKAGMHVTVATPSGYEPIPQVVRRATEIAARTGGSVELSHDPATAAKGADVVYTDVWASMGQELEHGERALIFKPYQLSTDTLAAASADVVVLHCLPAHRGEEIATEVMDGPNSAVFDQAENRLHTQKALLSWLLTGSADPQ
jgi:ornithine carbamoyltransferase